MRPGAAVAPAPVRRHVRRLLSPLAVPPVDDHLNRVVAGEVVLEVARQLRVAPRDNEQEAIRWARQGRGSTPTDLFARRGIREQYRIRRARPRTYSDNDRA